MAGDWNGTERRKIHPWRWRFLVAWVLVFTAATSFALWQLKDQNDDNKLRDARIQRSRVYSCQENRRAFQAVLREAFDLGRPLTESEQARLNTLLALVDPEDCREQVEVEGNPILKGG